MNKVADFSDTLADRWDELCYHDPEKLNDILRRTGLRKGLRILDIGCGTGVLESYLLPYSPLQIVGVDISPGMIEKARSKYATPIGHHDKHAGKLSEGLPPVEELARMLSPFFTVNTMEDSDRLYMISATRKQTF